MASSRLKNRGTIWLLINAHLKRPNFWWGWISAYGPGSWHIWKSTIDVEIYIQVLEQHVPPTRWHLLHRSPRIFAKTVLNRILHLLQQHGLLSVSPKLAYLQSRPTFTNWKHLAHEMKDRTKKQLESSITHECPGAALVGSHMFTDCRQRKRGWYTAVNTVPVHFFETSISKWPCY